jgi:transposase
LHREYGRAPRGQKIYQDVAGSRRGRTSILAAYDREKLVAPILFDGSCNSDVFNEWLEKYFLPTIQEGSVLIFDNASFHKSAETLEIIEKFNCELIFLPTYSPDLNPIEHKWPQLKTIVRKTLPYAEDKIDSICNAVLMLL